MPKNSLRCPKKRKIICKEAKVKKETNTIGDFNKAVDYCFESIDAAIKSNFIAGGGMSYTCIADVYSNLGNSKNAELYYEKSIQILRKTSDSNSLALALLNAGDAYSKNLKFNLALNYFNEAGTIFKKEKYQNGMGCTLGKTGMVYAKQGKDDLAIKNISEAITMLEKLEDYYGISDYLSSMADIYFSRNDWKTAPTYAKRSLEIA
jgi:adenylate cyclase